MNKKQIIFLEPRGSDANVFENYMKLPLLGSLYLATILHNAGYSVKIINENLIGRKISPVELIADIVCITCLTLNSNRAKELARGIRQMNPQTKIIFGGIHTSLLPDEFKDIADHIVIGEAEEIIIDVIEEKFTTQIINGRPLQNLDDLPLINYNLLVNAKVMDIIPLMSSRGCPFDCNFCTVTKIFGKRFRKQSIEKVIAEIKNALSFFKTRFLFFYDDNFTADKPRINQLMDRLIEEKINVIWTAQVRADISKDPDLLKKMYKSGCERVYIGFESINDEVLKSLHKSQTKKDIETAIDIIHSYGIAIHGMFMFGDDHDTLENIEETIDFAINKNIDTVQFMILTPLPGTQLFYKIKDENRLLHINWDFYDGMHTVFQPRNMSALELQQGAIKAFRAFYSFERTLVEILKIIFTIFYDALVWNFKRVFKYDLNNLLIKTASKFLIHQYIRINKSYTDYLSSK